MTDKELAIQYDKRVREIESDSRTLFTELGLLCREMAERELWRYISSSSGGLCHSLDHWIHEALPWSNGTAYSALGVARDCADIPVEERKLIPRGNLETLRKLSPAVRRDPLIMEAAKSQPPAEFVRTVAADFPSQHVENLLPMRFKPSEGQRVDIEASIELAMHYEGAVTREEALWAMAGFYKEFRPQLGVSEAPELEEHEHARG